MTRPLRPVKECYTEFEAAGYLNISINELYALLDEHIFNDGNPRPANLSFCEPGTLKLLQRNSCPTASGQATVSGASPFP